MELRCRHRRFLKIHTQIEVNWKKSWSNCGVDLHPGLCGALRKLPRQVQQSAKLRHADAKSSLYLRKRRASASDRGSPMGVCASPPCQLLRDGVVGPSAFCDTYARFLRRLLVVAVIVVVQVAIVVTAAFVTIIVVVGSSYPEHRSLKGDSF